MRLDPRSWFDHAELEHHHTTSCTRQLRGHGPCDIGRGRYHRSAALGTTDGLGAGPDRERRITFRSRRSGIPLTARRSRDGGLSLQCVELPDTRYARSGDLQIAYQVIGDGPIDLVHVPGLLNNLEAGWQQPAVAGFHERCARFARLILFDRRGAGLSDRLVPGVGSSIEERIDDVRAVMDAAGSQRAAVYGAADG